MSGGRLIALLFSVTILLGACVARAPIVMTPPLTTSPSEIVATEAGALRGLVEDGVETFRGIPYARAPVGALRWRAPQPAGAWDGVRPAEAFADVCMQADASYDPNWTRQPMSEDCLYLNVWTTARGGEPAPVMVWIHGGGFFLGSGGGPAMDGRALARRGVVLVSMNYRLGRFGFFAHPALTREANGEALANYGLMDQIAALRWVQRNIAAFGGDPDNVTIFGESAGGRSVNLLLTSPAAHGLFHKAIVQSGGERGIYALLSDDRPERPSAESIGLAFARHAGVETEDAAALRAIAADRIVDGLNFVSPQPERFTGVVIDGNIVTEEPYVAFRDGHLRAIPYLIGYNDGEFAGLPFIGFLNDAALRDYDADSADVRTQYGADDDAYRRYFANETFFEEPARRFARAVAEYGAPAYIYRFSYIAEQDRERIRTGAGHTSEIAYVFDTLAPVVANPAAADLAQATLMADYWTSFARTGNPNGAARPDWPRYDPASQRLMDFTNNGPNARTHQNIERLDYLEARLPDRRLTPAR
jgi:para-nitrobenzyl esterase